MPRVSLPQAADAIDTRGYPFPLARHAGGVGGSRVIREAFEGKEKAPVFLHLLPLQAKSDILLL